MNISMVERLGGATIRHLEYVGRLTIQFRNAIGSLGRTLPIVGNRYRWRSAVSQLLVVGVDAFPIVGIMAVCTGFILAMQGASELRRLGAINFVVGSGGDRVHPRTWATADSHRGERTLRVGILRRDRKHGGYRGD